MFTRRKKKHFLKRIKDLVWPSIEFRRAFFYISHRLGRLPATPNQIAGGFACGAAISFTPFIGLHFILSALLALLLRSSVIASAIGTVVGNPFTFPFIWALTYKTGTIILNIKDIADISSLFSSTISVFAKMNQWYLDLITSPMIAIDNFDEYLMLWNKIGQTIYPLIIGCILWVIIIWTITFFLLRPFFHAYKTSSEQRKFKKTPRTKGRK